MRKFFLFSAALSSCVFAADCSIDLANWWASPGEMTAVMELKKAWESHGCEFTNTQAAAGPEAMWELVLNRLGGGNPPTAFQAKTEDFRIDDLIAADMLTDMTDVAEKEGWEEKMLPQFKEICKRNGRWYCVALGAHQNEWAFTNKHIEKKIGMPSPKNFAEILPYLEKIKEAGIETPVAAAGMMSMLLSLNAVIYDVGGLELFDKLAEKDPEGFASPKFKEALMTWSTLSKYKGPFNPNGMWNESVNKLANNEAYLNILGDFALAEFEVLGAKPGVDYDCRMTSAGHSGQKTFFVVGGDVILFPMVSDPKLKESQKKFAAMLTSPEVQGAFNAKKGSFPTVYGVKMDKVHSCHAQLIDEYYSKDAIHRGNMWQKWGMGFFGQAFPILMEIWSKGGSTPAEIDEYQERMYKIAKSLT